jgi:AcrR family transcriptional regulator
VKRRDQILAEAGRLFAAHGFHGVTVADIGAACGISGPALYKHFASKEAMLSELLISVSEELLAAGRVRVAAAESPADALAALIDYHVDFALGSRSLIVVQDRDWQALPPESRARVRSLQRAYIELWADQLVARDPRLTRRTAYAKAQAGFGLMNSTPRAGEIDESALRVLLIEMATRALLASDG